MGALELLVLGLAVMAGPSLVRDTRAVLTHGPDALRYVLPARWARLRWRRLSRNLRLSLVDDYSDVKMSRRLREQGGLYLSHRPVRVRAPRPRWSPDPYGWAGTIRTVPGTGLDELSDAAPYLADAWRCVRVQITRDRPGRVRVRALRRDPLQESYELTADALRPSAASRLHVGRDEWFADRHVSIAHLGGVLVAGLPGYGKSSLLRYWLTSWALSDRVALMICDGKDAGDYDGWLPRAWHLSGDDLEAAELACEWAHEEMRRRHRLARVYTGGESANLWRVGPSPDLPLLVFVIDECHTFLATEGRTREDADRVKRITRLVEQLVKKGRSAMVLTILATQKQTGDAIPTRIRDVCGLSLAYACRTREAAVAALGEAVRDSQVSPVDLLGSQHVGIAVTLLDGSPDLVRVRTPWLPEEDTASVLRSAVAPDRPAPATVLTVVRPPAPTDTQRHTVSLA